MIPRPRTCAALVLAAVFTCVSAVPSLAEAAGRSYHVLKCHYANLPADELSQVGDHTSYERINECGASFDDPKFGIYNDGAAGNAAFEQFMYAAPPDTVMRSVCLQHKLRRQNHHRAEIFAWPGFFVLASGGEGPGGWSPTQCFHLNHQQLVIRLACSQPGGCAEGPNAHAYVRNVDIELEDTKDPVITTFEGSLLEPGWIRGHHAVTIDAQDSGGGMAGTVLNVNGSDVARQTSPCTGNGLPWPYSRVFVPCPIPIPTLTAAQETQQSPFANGANLLTATAIDFAGNTASQTRTVLIDNSAPAIAFANAQDPDDPELVRAYLSDEHSGLESAELFYRRMGSISWIPMDAQLEAGEVLARVDSSSLPTGDYEFKAGASDIAGNTSASTLRQNGTPMRLTFPLRFGTRLVTQLGRGGAQRQTVRYGTESAVYGRLSDRAGEPLANKELLVVEHFGQGALIRERPTHVVTDTDGEFQARIPAGPSRRVTVSFGGTQKYLPADREAGSLQVKSRASFVASKEELKEGQRVLFEGRVAHHGARIPAGGKLVELQVRVSAGRWDTVKEAFRTDGNGRYRLGYRFGRHYVSDAFFRFRLKIQGEADWPFRGGTSAQRKLIVRAR